MASEVEIVNAAMTLLGEGRITSLDDDIKQAREAKAIFTIERDALLAGYTWSFAKARAQLAALVGAPAFEYALQYNLPTDCLRLIFVGDYYVGMDLTDYRGSSTKEFAIEGKKILTGMSSPLNVQYIYRVTDTAQFTAPFVKAFACQLAASLAEPLTQSATKRQAAESALNHAISLAVRANAIELPPEKLPDDEWLQSRL